MMQAVDASLRRWAPTRSTSTTCTGKTGDAAGGDGARDGRPGAAGQDPVFRRLQLPRLAVAECATRDGSASPARVSQPYYNAVNRMPEVEHLPACRHYGVGVVPYSPLARGVLTGKYAPAPPPAGTAPAAGTSA